MSFELTLLVAILVGGCVGTAAAVFEFNRVKRNPSDDENDAPSIDWRTVAPGTPVLIRCNSGYRRGEWVWGSVLLSEANAFYYRVDTPFKHTLGYNGTITKNGEWHIDPSWVKIAETQTVNSAP